MQVKRRHEVLEQWQAGELEVVVATVAFGMGIDRGGGFERMCTYKSTGAAIGYGSQSPLFCSLLNCKQMHKYRGC